MVIRKIRSTENSAMLIIFANLFNNINTVQYFYIRLDNSVLLSNSRFVFTNVVNGSLKNVCDLPMPKLYNRLYRVSGQ